MLLAHLAGFPVFGSLWLEVLDSNEGKELSTFCRKFEVPLRKALEKAGRLVDDASRPRLLLTFISGRRVFAGVALASNSALWPMGIPRLKFPARRPAARPSSWKRPGISSSRASSGSSAWAMT